MNMEAYIDAVRSSLIANCGMDREDADNAINNYDLKTRIERCSLIINHDDPKAMAETINREQL